MLNRVVLVGRLTRDPDLRYTPNGVAVANFTVAVNRPFRNQQGEQEADFINCVTWRKQAENLAHYMKKGSLIGVDGRIQTRSYDNQEGKRVYVTEVLAENIQFLESRGASQQRQDTGVYAQDDSYQHQQPSAQVHQPFDEMDSFGRDNPMENDAQPIDISDDDLPF
jgi:single-strand DNA-binding protein